MAAGPRLPWGTAPRREGAEIGIKNQNVPENFPPKDHKEPLQYLCFTNEFLGKERGKGGAPTRVGQETAPHLFQWVSTNRLGDAQDVARVRAEGRHDLGECLGTGCGKRFSGWNLWRNNGHVAQPGRCCHFKEYLQWWARDTRWPTPNEKHPDQPKKSYRKIRTSETLKK